LSGAVVQHYARFTDVGVTYDWRSIWIFSAVASTVVLIAFLLSFHETETTDSVSVGDAAQTIQDVPL
jgi:hypothetical protein